MSSRRRAGLVFTWRRSSLWDRWGGSSTWIIWRYRRMLSWTYYPRRLESLPPSNWFLLFPRHSNCRWLNSLYFRECSKYLWSY